MHDQNANDVRLLETALMAAKQAGEMVKSRFGRVSQFNTKPDLSIVTEADLDAEHLIKELIQLRHPTHGFLGEETGRAGSRSGFTWIVDPIDGTKNFLRGISLFAVEVALLKNGLPHLGVSYLPAVPDLLWAACGQGAFSPSGRVAVSTVESLKSAYLSFGNLKHFARKGLTDQLVQLAEQAFQARGIGDAWSFHLLAQGKIDVFIDANTEFWDIAAFATIVTEAGGIITDFDGRPLGDKSSSVIAANKLLHPVVLEYFHKTPTNEDDG
jgi:histidinol-phosphatase